MKIFQRMLVLGIAAMAIYGSAFAGTSQEQTYALSIQSQSLDDALLQLAKQSGLQLAAYPDICAGLVSSPLDGRYTLQDALQRLLANTPLRYELVNPRTIAIRLKSDPGVAKTTDVRTEAKSADGVLRLADKTSSTAAMARVDESAHDDENQELASEKKREERAGISEILLVNDSRILNADIPRSRDDAQPYVVFDRETLERSGASDINDFLRKRLTMNTQGISTAQGQPGGLQFGNSSEINLRGLGSNQTLILIDGRRLPTATVTGSFAQPSISGIPLSAVERIEVLPTTASGIWGGSATGGAINIILRRDYAGAEAQTSYGVSENGGGTTYKIDFSTGLNFEGGRSNVLLAASYHDNDELQFGDRKFIQRAQAVMLNNNYPAGLLQFGLYPPAGATTNILSSDGSPLFGPGTPSFTSIPAGYAGGGGLAPLQVNAGRYNLGLLDSAQNYGKFRDLLPSENDKSIMMTLRRQFSSHVDAFLEGSALRQSTLFRANQFPAIADVSATAPNNPFQKNIRISPVLPGFESVVPTETTNYRAVGGIIVRLPSNWSLGADYTWSQYVNSSQSTATILNFPFAIAVYNGAVDALRDTAAYPIDLSPFIGPPSKDNPYRSELQGATLRIAGPLFSLPAGAATLSGLVEHRSEKFLEGSRDFWNSSTNSYVTTIYPARSQSVDSVYMEFALPLVSQRNQMPGVQQLELQIAGRHDEYRVNGATNSVNLGTTPIERITNRLRSTDPTISIRFQPLADLVVRASYGTGFLPPAVNQLIPLLNSFPVTLNDPRRGGAPTTIPAGASLSGGNPNLSPEQSESWSAGVILTPQVVEGLRLSVDYTNIDKTDNIGTPFSGQTLVNNESVVPDRILRSTTIDPAYGVGAIIGVNGTLFNISKARVRVYDVALDYLLTVSNIGTINFHSLATWQTHYKTQVTPIAPLVENVGVTYQNPLRLKANAGITWRKAGWTVDWSSRYFDSYLASTSSTVQLSQGNGGRVPSQTYHDVFGSYRFSNDTTSKWLRNSEIQLSIQNVFDSSPPVDLGIDSIFYSTFADPRLRSYTLTAKKSFD